MGAIGPAGFLWILASAQGRIGAFALHRMTRREPTPVEEQSVYVTAPGRTASLSPAVVQQVTDAGAMEGVSSVKRGE